MTGETEALRSSKPACRPWSKLPSSAYPRPPSLPLPSFLHPHLHPGWVILGEALPGLKLHLFFLHKHESPRSQLAFSALEFHHLITFLQNSKEKMEVELFYKL